MPPYVISEQSSVANRIDFLGSWRDVNALGEPVHGDPYGVEALTRRQINDEVHSYYLPAVCRYAIRHQASGRRCRKDLGAIATVASLDVFGHVPRDSRPPEITCDELQGLPASGMSSYGGIMMLMYDVVT